MPNTWDPNASPYTNYYQHNGVRYDLTDPANNGSELDSRGPAGIEGLALADGNSDASNSLYFGGSAGAANQQMANQRTAGVHASDRTAPVWDQSQSAQSRGMATGLGNQLQGLAAGDPNSLAQQQLHRGYAASNAALTAQAAGTRGGPLAASLARRTAGNQQSLNGQQESVASKELMAQQQMAAYGQMASLGAGLRGADQANAFGQANNELANRAANDAEQARREGLRMSIGGLGMQGTQNRQTDLNNWNAKMAGANIQNQVMADKAATQQTSTVLGAVQGGLSATGSLADQQKRNQVINKGP